jgi:hypothetical protein
MKYRRVIPAGLRWERFSDRRILKNNRGTVVMYIDSFCATEVAKNAQNEIIWVEEKKDKREIQICEAAKKHQAEIVAND